MIEEMRHLRTGDTYDCVKVPDMYDLPRWSKFCLWIHDTPAELDSVLDPSTGQPEITVNRHRVTPGMWVCVNGPEVVITDQKYIDNYMISTDPSKDEVTTQILNADVMLQAAWENSNLDIAIIIGREKNGETYFASTHPAGPDVLWLVEQFKAQIIAPELENEDDA